MLMCEVGDHFDLANMNTQVNDKLPFSTATAILDTGCGVGQVLGRIIDTFGDSLPATTRFVAADLSPGMIEAVKQRQTQAQHSNDGGSGAGVWERVEPVVWDAQDLAAAGVPDAAFSHVTAGLLLFMVPRPHDVFVESFRVLRAGGVFGLTSFRSVGWMDLIDKALGAVKPGTGLASVPAPWASTEAVRAQLEEAGFTQVEVEEVQTFYEFTDPEAMTRFNVANITER